MRSFKVIVCFIINFVLIFFFSFFLKFGNPLYLQQKEAKNISDLDTLIVGTSNGRLGIDPKILNEKLGWNSYSLSTGNTSISDIFYLVKDICKENPKVKRIVYELDYGYWGRSENLGYIDGFNMFFMGDNVDIKTTYLLNVLPTQCFIKAFSNNPLTPERFYNSLYALRQLKETEYDYGSVVKSIYNKNANDKSLSVYDSLGYWKGINPSENDRKNYHPIRFDVNNIKSIYPKRFHQLVKYCKKHSVELIVLQTPVAPRQLLDENRGDSHEWIRSLCESESVQFIDCNYLKKGLLPRLDNDYSDFYGHMLHPMAQRTTNLICEVLSSEEWDNYFYGDYSDVLKNITDDKGAVK